MYYATWYLLSVNNQYSHFHNTTISIFVKSTKICIQKALSVLHKSIYLSSFKSFFLPNFNGKFICKQSRNCSRVLPNKTLECSRNIRILSFLWTAINTNTMTERFYRGFHLAGEWKWTSEHFVGFHFWNAA